MKVIGHLESVEGGFDGCCGVCHCGRLWDAKSYSMSSVTNNLQLVFKVLFCGALWPCRARFWCTAEFQVHM